ncbi:MAG: pro-sigmaK processing inhibitor BofA family protein [Candidatus Micrarchaeota archaeon]
MELGIAIPLAGIALIAIAILIIINLKKIFVNTALGVAALLVINSLGAPYGVKLPVNLVTLAASAILGLAGVGLLIILQFLGINA